MDPGTYLLTHSGELRTYFCACSSSVHAAAARVRTQRAQRDFAPRRRSVAMNNPQASKPGSAAHSTATIATPATQAACLHINMEFNRLYWSNSCLARRARVWADTFGSGLAEQQ